MSIFSVCIFPIMLLEPVQTVVMHFFLPLHVKNMVTPSFVFRL